MSEAIIEDLEHPVGKLTDHQQQTLVASVTGDYARWKQARTILEKKWQECWEAYLCDIKSLYMQQEPDSADRSRVARPVLYEAVEAIHSNLLNVMFPGNERFFSVLGKREQDHRNALMIEEFLRGKLEEVGFFEKYAQFLKQAIVIGNTIAAVPWRRKTVKRRVNRPVTLFGVPVGTQKVTVEELIYNGPDFEVLDMFDVMIDPDEPDFEKAKVIRKLERSLLTLQQNPVYSNLAGLQSKSCTEEESHKTSRRQAFGIQRSTPENNSTQRDTVHLLEAWGDFRIDDELYENYVCVIANNERVIRFEPNPYDYGLKPFVFTTFIPVPNEVYGIGAIEKSIGLQHAINTLTNQKLDVINLSINNPFTYLINDDVFDPDTVVTRPGALIPVKSHDTLRPIAYLNNFTVAFTEIEDLKAEIQEATGALKYFTGSDQAGGARTATEVSALVSGGAQKFSFFISHLENTTLEPFLRMAFENAKQFMREPQTLRIVKDDGSLDFLEILPELLQESECSFRIEGSRGGMLKGQEIEAMVHFVELALKDPDLKQQVNVMELYRKIYRRLGFKDEGDIFLNPQQF